MARPTAGYSLLEMIISTICVVIMGMGIVTMIKTSSSAVQWNASQLDAHANTARAFQKVERHIRGSSISSLTTLPAGFETPQPVVEDAPAENIQFTTMMSVPGAQDELPSQSAPSSLYLEPHPNDPINGIDDNGDGIVDGQYLVLDRPGVAPERIASGVRGFQALLQGRELTLAIGIDYRLPGGAITTMIDRRVVEIRND